MDKTIQYEIDDKKLDAHEYTIDIHGETTPEGILDKLFNYVHDNMPNNAAPTSAGDLLVSHSNWLVRTSPTAFQLFLIPHLQPKNKQNMLLMPGLPLTVHMQELTVRN